MIEYKQVDLTKNHIQTKKNSTISAKAYSGMKNYKSGGMIGCPCRLKNQND